MGGAMRLTRAVLIGVPLVSLALISFPSHPPFLLSSAIAAETAATAAQPESANAYVGSETCQACHDDAFQEFGKTRMGRLFLKHPRDAWEKQGCESCHGPGKAHVDAGGGKGVGGLISFAKDDPTPITKQNATCLRCHQRGARLFWEGSVHESRDVACTNCHVVMKEVADRAALAKATVTDVCGQCHLQKFAQQMRLSHMPLREGKMDCASCHNPHGTVTEKLLKANSINDVCYICHADKRGPFLWEHPPVVESCANCHDPHGSNHERMLKLPKPRLCQQCHIENRHPTSPYTGVERFVIGRACWTCHSNIHGSNHPSGFAFTR